MMGTPGTPVTPLNFPALNAALTFVHFQKVNQEHVEFFDVPDKHIGWIGPADTALATLRRLDENDAFQFLNEIVMGRNCAALTAKHNAIGLPIARAILCSYVENGWDAD